MKKIIICIIVGFFLGMGLTFFLTNTFYDMTFERKDNISFSLFKQENSTEQLLDSDIFKNCYAYYTLREEEQLVYAEIYDTVMNHLETAEVSTTDINVLETAWRAVTADHGELFWTTGYYYNEYRRGDNVISLKIQPKYTMDYDDRLFYQELVDNEVALLLSQINSDASDYKKVRFVFDYLASSIDYELYSPNNQNILSVFLNQKTVCQGYSCAAQYLLDLLGVQCAVITGVAGSEPHTWNLVQMDGAYYYVDVTLGNSYYTDEFDSEYRFINYNYFGITTEELLKTHMPRDYFTLPECTAIDNNFYVKEGLYITEWNPDIIAGICLAAYEREHTLASMKFSNKELYEQAKEYFISNENLSLYINDLESLQYIANPKHNILTFKLR